MAKVTVYVTDEQLAALKASRGLGKGGMSKAFQAFLENLIGSGETPSGRYDYARKLMPVHAAIDRHRRSLARKVADGGPPADGGPVAAALTVLLYKELLLRDPAQAAAIEKEFTRFGLDELVKTELADIDLLAEPDPDDVEIDEDAGPSAFGFSFGDELRGVTEAIRTADAIRQNFMGRQDVRRHEPPRPPRPPRAPRPPRGPRGGRDRYLEIRISDKDDPRDLLTVAEFERFSKRHDDWKPGDPLTPSQLESVKDFLRERVNRELDADDDDDE